LSSHSIIISLFIISLLDLGICYKSFGQQNNVEVYSREDSLRGFLNPLRSCFDVNFYELSIRVNIPSKSITGKNDILFSATDKFEKIQLDLFRNMRIDSILFKKTKMKYEREGNAFFVHFPETIQKGSLILISIFYHGQPVIATNPPWDGGFVWEKDSIGRDWIGVACEGTGASLWWPNKDHLSDEPDSMRISIQAPDSLMAISNGRLTGMRKMEENFSEWIWEIGYPINNYNVTLNLGYYKHFRDFFTEHSCDTLTLDYYVLDYNLSRAQDHFDQVKGMLKCFVCFLGEFPFQEDGYALVEAPYWGMEHQSCIAYGNEYENNDYGFDFIIIHESAHEYWGNSVSVKDHAELWIHESFATYMEALYIEYEQGKEKALNYLKNQRKMIYNIRPILGDLHVNYNEWNDADMYYKGSWMLHSIRHTINNDSLWFMMLKAVYQQFKYKNVSSSDIIEFLNAKTSFDLKPIFQQYLTTTEIPELVVKKRYRRNGLTLIYRWSNVIETFNMPVIVKINKDLPITLYPTTHKNKIVLPVSKEKQVHFDTDLFYYQVSE